ncbi:hypothetical protein C1N79_21135 [Streptomyces sp. SGAir0924]|nr:hypothetical protein C1N79_21135 [Streptomyces sp. SGAir0924]
MLPSPNGLNFRRASREPFSCLGEKAGSYQQAGGVQLTSLEVSEPVSVVVELPLTVVVTFVWAYSVFPLRPPWPLPRC